MNAAPTRPSTHAHPVVTDAPRERLRRVGVDALSDAELLALVLGTGRPGEPVVAFAARLLATFGGAASLLRAGTGELERVLGTARAARLLGARELCRRAAAVRLDPRTPYASSRDVVAAYGPRVVDLPDERVLAIVLDARQRPVAERVLSVGGPAACPVGVREVFALAVREGGSAVLLVHNHPSGDPTPSQDDVELTRALSAAGRALELPLIDHVVVARDGSFSFLDAGLLASVPRPHLAQDAPDRDAPDEDDR